MAIATQPDAAEDSEPESIFAEINITPLTDVFLVMVVIFMVSALAVQAESNEERAASKREAKVPLELPPSSQHDIDPAQTSLVLEITLQGDAYVGGKRFTDAELEKLFAAAVTDKQMQVILRADRGVPHGRVVNIMDRARRAGFTRLAIGTGAAP